MSPVFRFIAVALISLTALPGLAEEDRERILVMDLKTTGVDADTAALVGELMGVTLSEQEALEVFSGADVKRLVELEADKSAMGCDDDTSCLADVAGALGAKYVIYGRMGKLGSRFIVTLNLFNADTAKAIQREDIKAPNLDVLSDELNGTVLRLIEPLVGAQVDTTVTKSPEKVSEGATTGNAVSEPAPAPETGSAQWLWFGSAAGVAVVALAIDGLSPTSSNDTFDVVDLVGPIGYLTAIGLGIGGVMAGGS